MSVLRRALFAWAVALSIWAMLIGLFFSSLGAVHPVQAQDTKPTKAPLAAPTKPPVEPQPTKEQIPPTVVPPTKESPPTEIPTKSPTSSPSKTPWPTGLPTKAVLPTSLPTTPSGPSTPSVGYGQLPVPTNTAMPSSASAGFPVADRVTPPTSQDQTQRATGALQPSQPEVGTPDSGTVATVTGLVFDDANDNGQRDPDEVGLPGVAVSVAPGGPPPDGGHGQSPAGTYIVVTDARGVYVLPMVAGATVRVIVPAGWSTRQSESLPLDRAGDFPLRARSAGTPVPPAASTPLTITQSVIDFAPLIALGLGLGVVMAIGFLRVARRLDEQPGVGPVAGPDATHQ